jgi:hypothetical protein
MKRRYWIYSFLFLLSVINYADRMSVDLHRIDVAREFRIR